MLLLLHTLPSGSVTFRGLLNLSVSMHGVTNIQCCHFWTSADFYLALAIFFERGHVHLNNMKIVFCNYLFAFIQYTFLYCEAADRQNCNCNWLYASALVMFSLFQYIKDQDTALSTTWMDEVLSYIPRDRDTRFPCTSHDCALQNSNPLF